MIHCRVPGCGRPIIRHDRWRAHCNTHHCRQRRHGHAEQRGVTVGDLKFYRKLVRERIKRNRDNSLWSQLDERWRLLTDHCKSVMAAWNSGRPQSGNSVRAATELLKVAKHVELRHVIETALALYLLQDAEATTGRTAMSHLIETTKPQGTEYPL
jgi:hypothetical protein